MVSRLNNCHVITLTKPRSLMDLLDLRDNCFLLCMIQVAIQSDYTSFSALITGSLVFTREVTVSFNMMIIVKVYLISSHIFHKVNIDGLTKTVTSTSN